MKISMRGQYALEALLCLSTEPQEVPCSIHSISEKTKISEGFLEQLFIPLKKAKLVQSCRGVQGGYRLNRAPSEISAFDVLSVVETSLKAVPCQGGGDCERAPVCDSKNIWQQMGNSLEGVLKSVTLEDLGMAWRMLRGEVF